MAGAGDQESSRDSWRRLLGGTEASSLVEFAISLPLLIILVVGIFDFGGAFNLKQELNNAAREGAHLGATQPTNDLCPSCTAPPSIDAVRYLVDSYLQAARLNDCGLSSVLASSAAFGAQGWEYDASGNGCPGTLKLFIARDPSTGLSGTPICSLAALNYGVNGLTVYLPCTKVAISYPYQWHFNNVIQLVSPGASYALTNIATNATVANTN